MEIDNTQTKTQLSNSSIRVPPAPLPSLNQSQVSRCSGTRCKRRTKLELAKALADPNNPYKGPRKRGKNTCSKGQTTPSSLASQSQSSTSAQTQPTESANANESQSSASTNLSSQTNVSSQDSSSSQQDSTRQFTRADYEHVCFFLEDEENFKQIFGSGNQTSVGGVHLTRTQAFDQFAHYLNLLILDVSVTGSQLRQRLDTYKNKYRKAKDFEQNTGAGIEEQEGYSSLKQKLEAICPWYNQMDALFREKENITSMSCFDSTTGTEIQDLRPNDLADGVGNPVPMSSQDLESAAGQNKSQPWTDWMETKTETQPTPRATRVGDLFGDSSTNIVIPPPLDFGSPQAGTSQTQESPTPAGQRSGSQDNQNQPASLQSTNSATGTSAARNIVPNLHRASSFQSVISSVSLTSTSAQSLVSVPSGQSGGLTAAFEASSMQKLSLMQSQLNLDKK
ncbi:hypothetical protein PCASD_16359 [Puccinia coronata f. sp. avenae]|uniref:Uncharacterized protein n=1 Tax=Puccinia coronata f. sp. avenae TaxID=200324 RepID=A0A2N5SW16_9BASI|nr:hypothetical protein PCASD_16359 [Puccinia coronata f. sp. avenae]